ncbi:hypothetical protein DPMN_189710 [Dreissena polymorpha]|uniref:Uncharacterized protein n=1 Tax=Dreissena polymorpha TaxID=45954 RepID=A0A9D4DW00_DREPO|nr:hypothetical protein DPMN_189688 [Dreissena polymorpha]KAH3755029.1 hypothetical protein DPMN_189710 [Dreissena polymorpha]
MPTLFMSAKDKSTLGHSCTGKAKTGHKINLITTRHSRLDFRPEHCYIGKHKHGCQTFAIRLKHCYIGKHRHGYQTATSANTGTVIRRSP